MAPVDPDIKLHSFMIEVNVPQNLLHNLTRNDINSKSEKAQKGKIGYYNKSLLEHLNSVSDQECFKYFYGIVELLVENMDQILKATLTYRMDIQSSKKKLLECQMIYFKVIPLHYPLDWNHHCARPVSFLVSFRPILGVPPASSEIWEYPHLREKTRLYLFPSLKTPENRHKD